MCAQISTNNNVLDYWLSPHTAPYIFTPQKITTKKNHEKISKIKSISILLAFSSVYIVQCTFHHSFWIDHKIDFEHRTHLWYASYNAKTFELGFERAKQRKKYYKDHPITVQKWNDFVFFTIFGRKKLPENKHFNRNWQPGNWQQPVSRKQLMKLATVLIFNLIIIDKSI